MGNITLMLFDSIVFVSVAPGRDHALHNMILIGKSTKFLKNVSQLVSLTASPKHPQSATGFQMAIHNVSRVITDINNIATVENTLFHTPKRSSNPRSNSPPQSRNDRPKYILSENSRLTADIYSPTFIAVPQGSIDLINPENINTADRIILKRVKIIRYARPFITLKYYIHTV